MLDRYLAALLLTLAIEGFVAYLVGLRQSRYQLAVAVINVITNLTLNYFLLVLGYLGIDVTIVFVVISEIVVVIAEWQLLVYIFGNPRRQFLIVSLLGNTASFLTGVLLFWI